MRVEIAYITPRRQRLKSAPAQALVDDFLKRASRYMPAQAVPYDSEPNFLATLEKVSSRSAPVFVALDSRGDLLTSEAIAGQVRRWQDAGVQHLVLAIGPPDGWSSAALARAQLRLSLGAITLPHELALVVLSEQLYRALTIIAGHPYHSGHG